jgi:hypothetical protein
MPFGPRLRGLPVPYGGFLQRHGGQMHMGKYAVGLANAAARVAARIYEHAPVGKIAQQSMERPARGDLKSVDIENRKARGAHCVRYSWADVAMPIPAVNTFFCTAMSACRPTARTVTSHEQIVLNRPRSCCVA